MTASVPMTSLLATKIGFGLVAVLVNAYCVLLVFRRLNTAEAGDDAAWAAIDARQHRFGAVVFAAMLIALALGGALFANG
jgi:ABC-type enterobactin transport system permease subunit